MSDESIKQDYETGYAKPPKSGQFKKGKSGNKKGRPKGSKNAKTLVNEVLNERVEITEAGKKKKISKIEALVRKAFSQAMKGDPKARAMFFELHQSEDPTAQGDERLEAIELADVLEFASRVVLEQAVSPEVNELEANLDEGQ